MCLGDIFCSTDFVVLILRECESTTVSEISRRDPRLKRHLQEKSEDKEEEVKEKRSKGSTEEKEEEQHKTCEHRPVGSGNEVFDGALQKQDTTTEDSENQGGKRGSPSSRKQSQSRSPEARSPCTQERSSHKRRHGSFSPSSSTPKIRKVSFTSAQPGPYGQGQQHLPYPGSFVQNPADVIV
ncbi:pre-mRNA cleavage complex 2 protein Pcf11-like isoform X2 [Strigops habroptila]|uniref:pre-mRNA cleavage complex 2 protein Pcf11-like isoform X2 n=1 Tax=Strigops habroptila TaxID=2489341 RepID=UPI0011D01B63|nr:pre-mRNA cleavage complex 2 protein Pcf11-like isoform X2 [Strigops habroptila]